MLKAYVINGKVKVFPLNLSHIMKIKRFYCALEACNKSFRSEEQLIAHSQAHSMQDELQEEQFLFQCDICKAQFPTKRSVSAHKRVHKSGKKASYTKTVVNYLTNRLIYDQKLEYQIPKSPFTVEDVHLPPISEPTASTLPPFSSLITK